MTFWHRHQTFNFVFIGPFGEGGGAPAGQQQQHRSNNSSLRFAIVKFGVMLLLSISSAVERYSFEMQSRNLLSLKAADPSKSNATR
jgi:hypothetical protein